MNNMNLLRTFASKSQIFRFVPFRISFAILLLILSIKTSLGQQLEISTTTYDAFGLFVKVSEDEAIYFFREGIMHNTLTPPVGKIVAQKYTYSTNSWSSRWTVFDDPNYDDRNLSGGLSANGDKIILNFTLTKRIAGVYHFDYIISIRSTDLSGTNWSNPTIIFDNTQNSNLIPIYEFYNASNSDRIYTATIDSLLMDSLGYVYQGIRFHGLNTQPSGSEKLYEYWSDSVQSHFYTLDTNQSYLQNLNYENKGMVCFVYADSVASSFPIFKYSHNQLHKHGFSFFKHERGYQDQGYMNTGSNFYAFARFAGHSSFGKQVLTNNSDIVAGWYARNSDLKYYCNTMRSMDDGVSWNFFDSKINEGDIFYGEANLNYLGEDSILSVMRNNTPPFFVGMSLSIDGGKTWPDATFTNISGTNTILPYSFFDNSTGKLHCCALDRGSQTFKYYSAEIQQLLSNPANCWQQEAIIDNFKMNGYASSVKFADTTILFLYAKELSGTNSNTYSFRITTESPLSLIDIVAQNEIKIFPNPFDQQIQIYDLVEPLEFRLTDINGRIVKSGQTYSNTFVISTSDIAKGFYYLFDSKKSLCKKLIKL
jgi:hypothetical protein